MREGDLGGLRRVRSHRGSRVLPLVLAGVVGVATASEARPRHWLGHTVNVSQSSFCVQYGCRLVQVRDNRAFPFDWTDGQSQRFRLSGARAGLLLDVDVRPGGWISGARLTEASRGGVQDTSIPAFPSALAAELLTAVTGRTFTAQAVQNCVDGNATRVLSQWATPAGLPFRAVCGPLTGGRGVAVGWGRRGW